MRAGLASVALVENVLQFKEALRAAGLQRPGRTTWCGVADGGVAVFTIWTHEIHKVNGRFFAWWSHDGQRDANGEFSVRQKGSARRFINLASENLGRPCRAVLVHPKMIHNRNAGVAYTEYPHPEMGTVVFRTADLAALQFIAELQPTG